MEYQDPNAAACVQQQAINVPAQAGNALWPVLEAPGYAKPGFVNNNVIAAPFEFASSIAAFNRMYKMESISPLASSNIYDRLTKLRKILEDEVREIDDIVLKAARGEPFLEIATDLADLMGDLQVFCASEMKRWNIPLNPTLSIIMNSNMSKLQEDGTALFIDGKLQKGPNYWQPEPQISMMLKQHWGLEVYDDGSNPVA